MLQLVILLLLLIVVIMLKVKEGNKKLQIEYGPTGKVVLSNCKTCNGIGVSVDSNENVIACKNCNGTIPSFVPQQNGDFLDDSDISKSGGRPFGIP